MRILVACELPASTQEQLRELGGDIDYAPDATPEVLKQRVTEASIIVVAKTRLPGDVIARAKSLQLIVRAGDGPGSVGVDEASQQGVFVSHCPNKRATAIAELAFAFIAALDREVVEHTLAFREGRAVKAKATQARGLAGRNIGILGFGAVGAELAVRARAFQMHVHAWATAPGGDLARFGEIEWSHWPRELARKCDVVVVTPTEELESQVLVDCEFLDNMPVGGLLVHVGNAGAVDESAVAAAITARQLRVALDSHGGEGGQRSRLAELPGVIATPRIGGQTLQARDAIAAEVARIISAFLVSGEVLNCLNLAERSPAKWQLVLRVRDQVGVMASILEAVRADGINAEEISSRVFTGAKAAWCTIALNERPSAEALDNIRSLADVLHLELRAVV